MGSCIYCGEKAGFLRSKHPACVARHEADFAEMKKAVHDAFSDDYGFKQRLTQIKDRAEAKNIKQAEICGAILEELTRLVIKRYETGTVYPQFVKDVEDTVKSMNLDIAKSGQQQIYQRLGKTIILADLRRGILPPAFGQSNFRPPVNLQKGESVIWAFRNVRFYEDRVHTRRVGGSRGVSIRVAKGVYYHTGRFSSHSVGSVQRDHIDTGDFLVATKAVYFAGRSKGFRVPYAKVISFEPFNDAMGIIKDGVNAKHQLFTTDDGWFMYNLTATAAAL